jgi:hypothetical protein
VRIPRSFLSLTLLRLKLAPGIFVPIPGAKIERRVSKSLSRIW